MRDGDRVSHRKYSRFRWNLECIPHVYTFTGTIKHGGTGIIFQNTSTIQIILFINQFFLHSLGLQANFGSA